MKTFSITDVGLKRVMNQDNIFCEENAIGSFPNLFIVADGMGGHKAGDTASRICVETLVETIQNSVLVTPVSVLEEAVQCANEKIMAKARDNIDFEGMGTTLVAASVIQDTLYIANVGDSRLYLLREGLSQITEDHSLVEEMVKSGELPKEEVRSHPNKNIITRALGINENVLADYFEVEVRVGDILLMCSDGLSNMLEDEEMARIIGKSADDIVLATNELKNSANAAGGKDNISIILIQI